MKKIYLVTGAAGHLGNIIIKRLLSENEKVRALVLPGDKFPLNDNNVEIFYGDIRNKESLIPFFDGIKHLESICIHCAGIVSIVSKYDQLVYDVNVNGTKNIMSLCYEYKIDRVIHVSSVHAIEENKNSKPITEVNSFNKDNVEGLYAKTKAEASQYVLEMSKKGLDVSIVHPSGILGPGDFGHGHLTQLVIDYLNHKLTAAVKGGYDFVDVRDVAEGILNCAKYGKKGECYILSNKHFEIIEILDMLHEITGKKKIKTVLPIWFAKLTAPLSEIYYKIMKESPLYTSYSLYTLTSNSYFSHDKATKELKYIPRDMKETLKDTADWLLEIGRVKR